MAGLPRHDGLSATSRLDGIAAPAAQLPALDVVLLIGCGAAAALAVALIDLDLRVPGHAILRAIFPMALGLALVPRRFGGLTMGLGALATTAALRANGLGPGMGATTSLLLIGPCLDIALWRRLTGWRVYAGFAAAGLAANVAAFAVRGGGKLSGGSPGIRPLDDWVSVAPLTYAACGLLAGLFSACVWFRLRPSERSEPSP